MKNRNILVVSVLMFGIIIGGILVKRNADLRRSAFFAGAKVWMEPKEMGSVELNKEVGVQIWTETDSGAKLSQAQFYLCYSPKINLNTEKVLVNKDAGFDELMMIPKNNDIDGNNCILVVALSQNLLSESFKSGVVKVIDLSFTTQTEGRAEIKIEGEKSALAGVNPESSDKVILIKSVEMINFLIENPKLIPTNTPTLIPTLLPTPSGCLKCRDVNIDYDGSDKNGGDYNCDGVINGADYVVWRNEFIDKTGTLNSDGNCDGKISISDYSKWREMYLK